MSDPDYDLLNSQSRALLSNEADVHNFTGHITCDPDSRSELVVPLIVNGSLIGVLDIDSPIPNRFTAADQIGVEKLCATFCELQSARDQFI